MKKTMIFVLVGLLVGIGGGSFLRGTKERDVILARMAMEKAAADSLASEEGTDGSHGAEEQADGSHGAEEQADGSHGAEEQADGSHGAEEPNDAGPLEAGDDPLHAPAPGEANADDGESPVEATGKAPVDDGEGSPEGGAASSNESSPETLVNGTPSPDAAALSPSSSPQLAQSSEALPEGPARLAKIFGAMDAKDAAAVLENLSDEEVQSILVTMSDRKVAAILGEFPPERAATLSRVVLLARSGQDR